MGNRVIVRLELSIDAKHRFSKSSDRMGMTQLSLSSRLVAWFESQPPVIQSLIMGHFSAGSGVDAARVVLQHLAGQRARVTEHARLPGGKQFDNACASL